MACFLNRGVHEYRVVDVSSRTRAGAVPTGSASSGTPSSGGSSPNVPGIPDVPAPRVRFLGHNLAAGSSSIPTASFDSDPWSDSDLEIEGQPAHPVPPRDGPGQPSQIVRRFRFMVTNYVPLPRNGDSLQANYFTTAWSSSGLYCAVGAETGHIAVLDAVTLRRRLGTRVSRSVLSTFTATRTSPLMGPGSIRSLLFSPAPWDLLVWAEDRGRICVVDLRDGLGSRQVIHLDFNSPNLTRVELCDSETTWPIDVDSASPTSLPIRASGSSSRHTFHPRPLPEGAAAVSAMLLGQIDAMAADNQGTETTVASHSLSSPGGSISSVSSYSDSMSASNSSTASSLTFSPYPALRQRSSSGSTIGSAGRQNDNLPTARPGGTRPYPIYISRRQSDGHPELDNIAIDRLLGFPSRPAITDDPTAPDSSQVASAASRSYVRLRRRLIHNISPVEESEQVSAESTLNARAAEVVLRRLGQLAVMSSDDRTNTQSMYEADLATLSGNLWRAPRLPANPLSGSNGDLMTPLIPSPASNLRAGLLLALPNDLTTGDGMDDELDDLVPGHTVRTQGLVFSPEYEWAHSESQPTCWGMSDGSKPRTGDKVPVGGLRLFAATEYGIFEYGINLRHRSLFPAVVVR